MEAPEDRHQHLEVCCQPAVFVQQSHFFLGICHCNDRRNPPQMTGRSARDGNAGWVTPERSKLR